jgi:hypothetical protein
VEMESGTVGTEDVRGQHEKGGYTPYNFSFEKGGYTPSTSACFDLREISWPCRFK